MPRCGRVCATEHAPRDPFRLLQRRHGLAEFIERGAGVHYAEAVYKDKCATLDSLREAVTRLEETERISRRIFGGAHWMVVQIEGCLLDARKVLRARETPSARA